MKHRGKLVKSKARFIMTMRFRALDDLTQIDIAMCIRDLVMAEAGVDDATDVRWREAELDVWPSLRNLNPIVPLLGVDPSLLAACKLRALYSARIEEYEDVWKKGGAGFPPIIIDTTSDNHVLCEGGHRACSAERTGIKEILAVDISEMDLKPVLRELGL